MQIHKKLFGYVFFELILSICSFFQNVREPSSMRRSLTSASDSCLVRIYVNYYISNEIYFKVFNYSCDSACIFSF